MLLPLSVHATEGEVYSVKQCYGNLYGYHYSHWHIATPNNEGKYIASGEAIYSDPCGVNNDNTLKSLIINNENIQISDNMEYKTYSETVNIVATPNYEYASIAYEQTKKLNIGKNSVPIKVISVSGNIKIYNLTIIRQKVLSKNNNIKKIIIENKEYQFKNNVIKDITLTSNQKKLKLKITLEDKTAKAIVKNNNLKVGNNKINIVVKAEDGSTQKYYIKAYKTSLMVNFVGTTIGILILLSPLIIVLIIFKYKNKKKYINNTKKYIVKW